MRSIEGDIREEFARQNGLVSPRANRQEAIARSIRRHEPPAREIYNNPLNTPYRNPPRSKF